MRSQPPVSIGAILLVAFASVGSANAKLISDISAASRGETADLTLPAYQSLQVTVGYRMGTAGAIGDVWVATSSGNAVVDNQALSNVRHQLPSLLDKSAGDHVMQIMIGKGVATPTACNTEPTLSGEWNAPTLQDRHIRRQVEIDENGNIVNMLLLSRAGWRRYDPAVLAQIKSALRYSPGTRDGRPASCWFDDDAYSLTPLARSDEQPIAFDARQPPPNFTLPQPLTSHRVFPFDYPWEDGHSGATTIKYVILSDGSIGQADIVASSGFPEIDAAALKVVRRWLFSPATLDGKPVAMWQAAKVVMRQD